MEHTINDIIREVVEGEGECDDCEITITINREGESGLDCVPTSEWEWEDCDKGHAECYMAICPACKTIDRDCEDKQP